MGSPVSSHVTWVMQEDPAALTGDLKQQRHLDSRNQWCEAEISPILSTISTVVLTSNSAS
jgi:hypothetical protein